MNYPVPNLSKYDPQVLINSQPVIVSIIDSSNRLIQLQTATSLMKFGSIVGSSCHEKIFGCPSPCSFCRMPEALTSDTVVSSEVSLPNGQFFLVHWSKAATADGRTHVMETIVDITEHKRTTVALLQSQKMESVGRLASGIAHDFNNLMMVVIGHAERLLQKLPNHPARQEVERISQVGMRAAALTKKLLIFSRGQVFAPKELPVNQAIREMVDILRSSIGQHIQMVVVLHPHTGNTLADPVQLDQVTMNLVLNARDAMPDGGLLNIETDNASLDEQFVRTHPGSKAGPYVKIMFQDTGCGMSAETISHIFEPFFTTKGSDKGTGLGLATAFAIVKQSQGYIEVASEPGRGSQFTVYLPRVGQPAIEPNAPQKETASTAAQETILVVENEESVRNLVVKILQDQGYHVLTAGDGVEALQKLEMLKGKCPLVITDIVMPRMEIAVFAGWVKTMRPETKMLYMSGYADNILQANGMNDDMPFLEKPFLPTTLVEKVRELLQTASPR